MTKRRTPQSSGGQPQPPATEARPSAAHSADRPPPHLTATAAAIWTTLAPTARAAGTLHTRSVQAFELLTETLATERSARRVVDEAGITVTTGRGGVKPHPAVRTMETARTLAADLLKRFALDPAPHASDQPAAARQASAWAGVLPPVAATGRT